MVSIRNQRPPNRSSPGGSPGIDELEQKVRNKHGFPYKSSDIPIEAEKKWSNQSLEQARDHEFEENRNVIGERRDSALVTDTETFSVPVKKAVAAVPTRASPSPLDQVQPKLMSMPSILVRSRPTVKVWLQQDLNEMPAADSNDEFPGGVMDLPSIQSQPAAAGLNQAPDFVIRGRVTGLPVKWNSAADDLSHDEDEDSKDDELARESEDSEEKNMDEISGEMSDCSLERRYITKQRIVESRSVRLQIAFRQKEKSDIMPDCQLVGEMTDIPCHPLAEQGPRQTTEIFGRESKRRNQRNYKNGSDRIYYGFPKRKFHATASASNRHLLRSCTVSNDQLDEGDPLRKLREGSLLHSLYLQVLASGREGISMEELLISLHCQSVSAMLADDWEDRVEGYLNRSPYFVQVQGQYRVLSRSLDHLSSKRFAQGEEKKSSLHSTIGCGGESRMQATRDKGKTVQANERGRVSMCNKEPGKRIQGTLLAKQAKITAEYGLPEGARRCALVTSLHRKRPWQCPMTAMEGHRLCEHHFVKTETTKKEARLQRKFVKSKR